MLPAVSAALAERSRGGQSGPRALRTKPRAHDALPARSPARTKPSAADERDSAFVEDLHVHGPLALDAAETRDVVFEIG